MYTIECKLIKCFYLFLPLEHQTCAIVERNIKQSTCWRFPQKKERKKIKILILVDIGSRKEPSSRKRANNASLKKPTAIIETFTSYKRL